LGAPTNFDTTRVRLGELIAGGSGLVLIISLFLNWYSVSAKNAFVDISQGVSGWDALSLIDLLCLVVGGLAIAVAVGRAANMIPRQLPASPGFILLVAGGIALLFVLFRLISIPDGGAGNLPGVDVGRSIGVFLAFLAAAGVTLGGWLTWNEEGKPKPGGAVGGAPGAGAPLGPGQPYGGGAPPYGGQPQAPAQPQQQAYAQPAAPAAAAPAPAEAQPAAAAAVKADWYPDPRGEKRLRYWDGSQWTDHTAD
jgi:hypothetical protein